jgi:hypothetical protein
VCADSYFSSVGAVEELRQMNLRFIWVVKTATKKFPMKFLQRIVLGNRGDRYGVVAKDPDGNVNMLAFVWMDRDRRYFIASASSLAEGAPNVRNRWRQLEDDDKDADPTRVTLTVPQPRASEVYYNVCAKVDHHNRSRQAFLNIEKKLVTTDWSLRVNFSIFSICVVDAWKVYSQLTYSEQTGYAEMQKQFYGRLAAELIDNTYDKRGGSRQSTQPSLEDYSPVIDRNTGEVKSEVGVHITKTKKRQRDINGNDKFFPKQQGQNLVTNASDREIHLAVCLTR